MRDSWTRLNGSSRIAGIDLARGLAVIGMFAAHLLVTADDVVWTDARTWTALVNGRSSILFATLAGVSIGIVTGGRTPLTGSSMVIARIRIVVRALALWVLGILLTLTGVPVYVILPAYAILFVLALGFTSLSARSVFVVAVLVAVVMPFLQPALDGLPLWEGAAGADWAAFLGWHYPFTVWIAFVLAGLAIARAGITRLGVQWRMLLIGAVTSAAGYLLAGIPAPDDGYWASVWTADAHSAGLPEVIGSGGFAIAVIGGCLLLCRVPIAKHVVLPLRAMGAMPLTAYTAQLVAWAIIALAVLGSTGDYFGFIALEPFWPMTIIMLAACTAWALLIGRGPLEWALAKLSMLVGGSAPRQ